MNKIISDIFKKYDVSQWGVCDFSATLPLIECRAKMRIPENAKSVIVCLFPYYVGENDERNLARYAVVADYHKVAGEILKNVCDELKEKFNATENYDILLIKINSKYKVFFFSHLFTQMIHYKLKLA